MNTAYSHVSLLTTVSLCVNRALVSQGEFSGVRFILGSQKIL